MEPAAENVEKIREVIEGLFSEVISELSKCYSPENTTEKLISSATLIGPLPSMRIIRHAMDFDIVVIVRDPMTVAKYRAIDDIFSKLSLINTSAVEVTHRIALGFIPPIPTTKWHLLFHVLLFTEQTYRDYPIRLAKRSWPLEGNTLLGENLLSYGAVPDITSNEVLNGILGLKHCLELLKSRCTTWFVWEHREGSDVMSLVRKHVPLKDDEVFFEFCVYSVLRGASNALRLMHGGRVNYGIGRDDMMHFKEVFGGLKLSGLPLYFAEIKERMRDGSSTSADRDLTVVSEKSQSFLAALYDELERKIRPGSSTTRDKQI